MSMDRRSFLRRAGIGAAAAGAVAVGAAPFANAQSAQLPNLAGLIPGGGPITGFGSSPRIGTIIDYSAGVPSAGAVRAAGHMGAVRYCSNRRPGAEWMLGKPLGRGEADDFRANGLTVTSCYQFGKGDTTDWLGGAGAAAQHAPQGIAIHYAAGGPAGAAMYVAIDDNPSRAQYDNQIRPYLQGWDGALRAAGLVLGVYCNAPTIDWCRGDNIGTYFWQHGWGSGGQINPAATMYQVPGLNPSVGGVSSDVNDVYSLNYGQWGTSAGFQLPQLPDLSQIPLPQGVDLGSLQGR